MSGTGSPSLMVANFFVNLLVVAATLVMMEGVAWASHRYVMHGWGWNWHASHHARRIGAFEKNDLFAIAFAGAAIGLIALGTSGWWPAQWVGAGMTAYGALYALVHDGYIHRRWGGRLRSRSVYLQRLEQAHRLHHACETRDGAVSFGFLLAPSRRRLQRHVTALRRQRQRTGRSVRRRAPSAGPTPQR